MVRLTLVTIAKNDKRSLARAPSPIFDRMSANRHMTHEHVKHHQRDVVIAIRRSFAVVGQERGRVNKTHTQTHTLQPKRLARNGTYLKCCDSFGFFSLGETSVSRVVLHIDDGHIPFVIELHRPNPSCSIVLKRMNGVV
jgi:hypothetical protein